MEKWEDIIKDKLEGYESPLPEGSLEEFRALRNGAAVKPAARRVPLVWVLAPALAAGLAAVLIMRQPSVPEDGVRIISEPAAPVAVAPFNSVSEPEYEEVKEAVPSVTGVPSLAAEPAEEVSAEPVAAAEESVAQGPVSESSVPETVPAQGGGSEEVSQPAAPQSRPSPFVPLQKNSKQVKLKVSPVAGAVAGGGLLAALLTPSIVKKNDLSLPARFRYLSSEIYNGGGSLEDSIYGDPQSSPTIPPEQSGDYTPSEGPKDVFTGQRSHKAPFRTGITARVPLSERLYLTTGLEYSRYESAFRFALSGEQTQTAHYIGIPVRLDWTLASGRWLDVYLGAGLGSDYCINATLGGRQIAKDGFSFSLLGAAGIQFNMTKRLGLYAEPGIRYSIPSGNPVLETYRTVKPLHFSVSTGVRITL